jgi:iron complex transport system substrate-binding protein
MRVVTLLPGATEIVAALGAGEQLVGISHECDHPASVQHLPRVTATPIDPSLPGAAIDAEVRRLHAAGQPVIGVDAGMIRRLSPELIITQDLCQVCAVADGEVHRLAAILTPAPRVLALTGRTFDGVLADIRSVGNALDRAHEGHALATDLRGRLDQVRASARRERPRVLCIEWLDPLYLAGHWVPDLVAAAGGIDVGAEAGAHSVRTSWTEAARRRPDLIVVMLCGLGVERSRAELARLGEAEARALLGVCPVWVLDGNAFSSRPGPRLVDGAVRLQAAMAGAAMPGLVRWPDPA